MSRSGFSDDFDGENWQMIMAAGRYRSAVRGKRGQAFLRELLAVLDAMPVKELIADELQADGAYCALGALGAARGIDLSALDTYDHERLAKVFGISETLSRHVMYENDEWPYYTGSDESKRRHVRWQQVRAWVASEIRDGG